MNIQKSSEMRTSLRINSLSIGDSGKGKTFFHGSMWKYGKPFVIDSECGLATICDKDFDFITVDTWDEFLQACKYYFENWKKEGYTHLVIDSISRLQRYLGITKSPNGKLTQSQWGEVLAELGAVIDRLTKHCPTHLHVTCMATESKDGLDGSTKIFPNMQGQFKYDLAGYFDIVLYHDCGERDGKQVYWVQTEGDERIVAKNRFNSIHPLSKYDKNDYEIINNIITTRNGTKKEEA